MPRRSVGFWWLDKPRDWRPPSVTRLVLRVEKFTMAVPWFSKTRHLPITVSQFDGDETAWVECRGLVRAIGTRDEVIAVIRSHHVQWLAEVPDRGN